MTEAQELKTQLCVVLSLSNDVEAETDPIGRRLALEQMQKAIQDAGPLLKTYAADLMVELED